MTILSPSDRAALIIEAFKGQTFSEADDAHEWLQRQIEKALEAYRDEALEIADRRISLHTTRFFRE